MYGFGVTVNDGLTDSKETTKSASSVKPAITTTTTRPLTIAGMTATPAPADVWEPESEFAREMASFGIRIQPQGKGKMTYANGDVYVGEFKDGKRQGIGKIIYANGDVYEGGWLDGKQHGKGKETGADGWVYEGDWVNGMFQGKGKFTWADGRVYEGGWWESKTHGKGKFTYANGTVYEGNWMHGFRVSFTPGFFSR
jgi:hypothetical protein